MAIALIEDWFNTGCDFQIGVDIYLKYGSNKTLKNLFQKSENSFTRKKLREELEAILEHLKPQEIVIETLKRNEVSADEFSINTEHKNLRYDVKDFPKDLKELDKERKRYFAKAVFLKNTLINKSLIDRRKALAEIKHIMRDVIPGIYKQLDFYYESGERLSNGIKEKESIADLVRQRNNARTKVSRYKGENGKEHLLQKWQTKLNQLDYKIETFA